MLQKECSVNVSDMLSSLNLNEPVYFTCKPNNLNFNITLTAGLIEKFYRILPSILFPMVVGLSLLENG